MARPDTTSAAPIQVTVVALQVVGSDACSTIISARASRAMVRLDATSPATEVPRRTSRRGLAW